MQKREAEAYDVPAVEAWIADNVDGLEPPFDWTRLEGGHSNLTYRLENATGDLAVIRRPPQGQLLPKAHDMSREWALISALGPTRVPVPAALGFCESPAVTGAWFYLMGLVDGQPLYSAGETRARIPAHKRAGLACSFIDVLGELHALDPAAIGLGDLGRKDGYVARQLKTWYRSWMASVEPARFDDERAHRLQQYFSDKLPEQGTARVVHGDYGLHNCLIGPDHTIVAVVDWEISSLGDPLADLAYALNPFPDPADDVPVDMTAAAAAGFPARSELAARYAERTGRNLNLLDYYIGFNCWKSACIIHGVYARYMEGKKSVSGVDLDSLRERIEDALAAAERATQRLEAA